MYVYMYVYVYIYIYIYTYTYIHTLGGQIIQTLLDICNPHPPNFNVICISKSCPGNLYIIHLGFD